jgi:diguanylate cyclase (GGDEF)-like protein
MTTSILVLDDDQPLRQLVAAQLAARGHRVIEAGTAKQAWMAIAKEIPDAAIVDGLLPDTQGVRFIAQMRERGITIPIVFVSAYWRDLNTFRVLTCELAVASVLYKPLNVEALVDRISALVDEAAGQNQAARPLENLDAVFEDASLPDPRAEPEAFEAVEVFDEDTVSIDDVPSLDLDTPSDEGEHEELIALQREYAAALPDRIDELANAINALQNRPSTLPEVMNRAHRLRGTAGTFGFSAVSHAAAEIEDLLVGALAIQETPAASLWPRLDRALRNAHFGAEHAFNDVEPANAPDVACVLIVGVEMDLGVVLSDLVHEQLFGVTFASSLQDAIDKAESQPLAAAIIELKIGDDTAFDLIPALRTLRNDLPVAVVSSDRSLATRILAVRAGVNLFLDVPISRAALALAMRKLLSPGQVNRPDRVLLVATNEEVRENLRSALHAHLIDVQSLIETDALFQALHTSRPDLLLIDADALDMPASELHEALALTPGLAELPIVVLNANGKSPDNARSTFAVRDDTIHTITSYVRGALAKARLQRERTGLDALTGLSLRRSFLDEVELRLLEAQGKRQSLALVLIDVASLPEIEQAFDEERCDALLSAIGRILTDQLRDEDLRCRWEHGAFAVLLPSQTIGKAKLVATRLKERIVSSWPSSEGETSPVTLRIGIACFPDDGLSATALVVTADQRLAQ